MVLFVSYSDGFGGAERLLVDFAAGLGHECAIACPPGRLRAAARTAGLRTFSLRSRPLQLRGDARRRARALAHLAGHRVELARLVAALDPELLVAWGMRSALATVGLKLPVAFQHNDMLPGVAIGAAVRRVATRMVLVTAPSLAVLADLDPSGRLGSRAQVIAPGVALERFGEPGAPAAPPELLVLGALARWKQPELALETFALVRARVTGVRLCFAGAPLPGDDADVAGALHRRAAALGVADAVAWAGELADPVAALERCSLLLHCAQREPFGIAVLEALAAGRPAVVPDSAGPAEIVDDGCGVRYPPGDAAAAADAVVGILGEPGAVARLGQAGRARAAAHFALADQQARYRAALGPWRRSQLRSAVPVALVTVTHNSERDLTALLESVRQFLPAARVIVADCASHDGTVAVARAGADEVIELPNLGFGRACNRALARVTEPIVALINPDVELIDDSLLELAIEAHAPGGEGRLFAPRVLNPDGSIQDTVHPAPLSAPDLIRSLLPPAALPGRLGVALAPWRSAMPRRVGWAVGCALVTRTQTLRALRGFDERIFLYGEDMELGLRAAAAGVSTWLWPVARVIHHGGRSIEAAYGGEAFELRAKARHDAVALALGERQARIDDAAQAITFASRLACKRALRRDVARERRQLRALRAVRRARPLP